MATKKPIPAGHVRLEVSVRLEGYTTVDLPFEEYDELKESGRLDDVTDPDCFGVDLMRWFEDDADHPEGEVTDIQDPREEKAA